MTKSWAKKLARGCSRVVVWMLGVLVLVFVATLACSFLTKSVRSGVKSVEVLRSLTKTFLARGLFGTAVWLLKADLAC